MTAAPVPLLLLFVCLKTSETDNVILSLGKTGGFMTGIL